MGERTFPVHPSDHKHGLTEIAWAVVEPHRQRALRNHGQTLERLAERGALGLFELECLFADRSLFKNRPPLPETSLARVKAAVGRALKETTDAE